MGRREINTFRLALFGRYVEPSSKIQSLKSAFRGEIDWCSAKFIRNFFRDIKTAKKGGFDGSIL
jgi:hypothetical protein